MKRTLMLIIGVPLALAAVIAIVGAAAYETCAQVKRWSVLL